MREKTKTQREKVQEKVQRENPNTITGIPKFIKKNGYVVDIECISLGSSSDESLNKSHDDSLGYDLFGRVMNDESPHLQRANELKRKLNSDSTDKQAVTKKIKYSLRENITTVKDNDYIY